MRWRLKDLAARAMARSGVSISVSAMWRTVRGIGFSHRAVRPLHPRAGPGRQSGFRNGSGGLAPGAAGEGAAPGRTGIWFQDGQAGISMEELVRRLIREKRAKHEHRLKPSEAFARYFGEEHGVELPSPARVSYRPLSFSGAE